MHTRARSLPPALLLVALLAGAAAARQGEARPLITVTGQAELRVPPDEAAFDLVVVRLDKDVDAAREQTDQSVRQILELARRYGVPRQNVRTDFIAVSMKYNTDLVEGEDDGKKLRREFVGYEVTKSVNVRFADLPRFEGFFADVLKAGVSKVNSVTFYTSQLRKYRDEARAAAVRAAREKAVALTAELGQTIGKAYRIEEEAPRDLSRSNSVGLAPGSYSSEESAAFAPGTIAVTAQVTVSFLLN